MKRWLYILPLALFAALAAVFAVGLRHDPSVLPSALIDKPVPSFALPPMENLPGGLATADLQGKVALVNTFASWCVPCRIEHPVLMTLAARRLVPIFGINYKDKPAAASAWISALGNPYTLIGADLDGRAGIEWGVYGVPETFVVDASGHIRYKHVGPLTEDVVNGTLLPMIARLRQ